MRDLRGRVRTAALCVAVTAALGLAATKRGAAGGYGVTGGCAGSGGVTIEELIIGVNIAPDNFPVSACPSFDYDGSGQVTVDELVRAVNAALTGGTPGPTVTPTPTPTPGTESEFAFVV